MAGCVVEVRFEPIGGDVSVEGTWTINGGPATAETCEAGGIARVRLQICEFADGDCFSDTRLEGVCSAGGFSTSPFLLAGTYAIRWQALSATGSVLGNSDWQTVTAAAATTLRASVDFTVAGPSSSTLDGEWLIDGEPADAASCAAAGIANIRLTLGGAAGDVVFSLPCADGGFDSRSGMGPSVAAGTYTVEWEALDAGGALLAGTGELPAITAVAGGHVSLTGPDFVTVPTLLVSFRYAIAGTETYGTCTEATVGDTAFLFELLDAEGNLLELDVPITTCINEIELSDMPPGEYDIEISAESPDGSVKWGTGVPTSCGGLSVDWGISAYDCFVDIVD
ncbi:MAG: hypothetical protein KF901_17905, partial [Myxococcales bacterium]|nr:hypothetical protein [Myxococcales bacterium]